MTNETYAITKEKRTILCELIEKDGFPNQPALDLLNSLPLITVEPVATVLNRTEKMLRVGVLNPAGMLLPDGTKLYTHAQPLPKGEPVAWLINFKDTDGTQRSRSYMHNAIGDYRQIDPNATSEELFTHAQPPQPITDKDVTAEMINLVAEFDANFNSNGINVDQIAAIAMAFIVNTFNGVSIKHKGDTT